MGEKPVENMMEENLCEHQVQRIQGRKSLKNEEVQSEAMGIK